MTPTPSHASTTDGSASDVRQLIPRSMFGTGDADACVAAIRTADPATHLVVPPGCRESAFILAVIESTPAATRVVAAMIAAGMPMPTVDDADEASCIHAAMDAQRDAADPLVRRRAAWIAAAAALASDPGTVGTLRRSAHAGPFGTGPAMDLDGTADGPPPVVHHDDRTWLMDAIASSTAPTMLRFAAMVAGTPDATEDA